MGNHTSVISSIQSGAGHRLSFSIRTGEPELDIVAKGPTGKDWEPRLRVPIRDVAFELSFAGGGQLTLSGKRVGCALSAITDGGKVCSPALVASKDLTLRERELKAGEADCAGLETAVLDYTWSKQVTASEWQRVNAFQAVQVSATFTVIVRTGSKLCWKGYWARMQVVREVLTASAEVQICLEVRWCQPPRLLREMLLRFYREYGTIAEPAGPLTSPLPPLPEAAAASRRGSLNIPRSSLEERQWGSRDGRARGREDDEGSGHSSSRGSGPEAAPPPAPPPPPPPTDPRDGKRRLSTLWRDANSGNPRAAGDEGDGDGVSGGDHSTKGRRRDDDADRSTPGRRRDDAAVDVGVMRASVWPKVAAAGHVRRLHFEGAVRLFVAAAGAQVCSSRWVAMPV